MKINLLKLLFTLLVPGAILISSCSQPKDNFDWLTGQWVRINDSEGNTTYEFWNKKNESRYTGLGFTLQQADTIWKENIQLLKKDGKWSFEVSGMNDLEPTIFQLSSLTKSSFVLENEENEFPKKIEYRLINNNIHAIISGGGPEILFEFEKWKP